MSWRCGDGVFFFFFFLSSKSRSIFPVVRSTEDVPIYRLMSDLCGAGGIDCQSRSSWRLVALSGFMVSLFCCVSDQLTAFPPGSAGAEEPVRSFFCDARRMFAVPVLVNVSSLRTLHSVVSSINLHSWSSRSFSLMSTVRANDEVSSHGVPTRHGWGCTRNCVQRCDALCLIVLIQVLSCGQDFVLYFASFLQHSSCVGEGTCSDG